MINIYKNEILKAGEIKPKGWIKEQLEKDLTEGYIGQFDKVHPTVNQNVFKKQDRLSRRKFTLRKEWWSGEHEGYWKDAVIRMAFLTDNEQFKQKVEKWIDELITHAGKDGYIGIYKDCDKPDCRFNHVRGNGELWTTSRILMALLAYHEFTGDKKALEASEKAANLIMDNYAGENYFHEKSRGGGISHGIGFFENLEWLYRLTGKEEYLLFAVKLYKDFNVGRIRDDDLKTKKLLNEDELFEKHGAHIAEGLFVPEFIAAIDKEQSLQKAADLAIVKLLKHLTPGGAMRCDEWIKGLEGTADERYEYCGIAEMISPMNKIISFTNNLHLADRLETMTFNAAQGARFPVLKALSYLTSDNRLRINHREIAKRETYDAAHLAAVCCVLNGGRLMPYFVEGMWMKDIENDGLLALLFGPNELNTTIRNTTVQVIEETEYPFSDKIIFTVNPESKIEFPFTIRIPHDCKNNTLQLPKGAKITEDEEKIIINNTWEKGDQIIITFDFEIKKIEQPSSKTVKNEGIYLKRGPLVFALPFEHQTKTVREYRNSGFYRYKITAKDTSGWNMKMDKNANTEFIPAKVSGFHLDKPSEKPGAKIKVSLTNKKGEKDDVLLVPLGNTILRRVTFPVSNKQ